jgi:hypothetical protein
MFYLKSFWKTVLQNPFRGLFFVLFSTALFLGILAKGNLDKNIFSKVSLSGQESFFYALIDDKENQARIARKLRALPGVKTVEILTSNSINVKATEVIKNVGLGLSAELMNLDYSGLKIIFMKKISFRSIKLIRDYLNRLVGKKHITMGGIKAPKENQVKLSGILKFIKSWGATGLLVILFFLWTVSYFQFGESLSETAYLIQNFQRRNQVAVKMLIFGMLSFSVLAFLVHTSIFGVPALLNTFIVLAIAALAIIVQAKSFRWNA